MKNGPLNGDDPDGTCGTGSIIPGVDAVGCVGGPDVQKQIPDPAGIRNAKAAASTISNAASAAVSIAADAWKDLAQSLSNVMNGKATLGDNLNVLAAATIPVGGEGEAAELALSKVVNSNIAHAIEQGVSRGIFEDAQSAGAALRDLASDITKTKQFPAGTVPDTAHARSFLVPVGQGGYAVYRVAPNGTAKLRTILIAH